MRSGLGDGTGLGVVAGIVCAAAVDGEEGLAEAGIVCVSAIGGDGVASVVCVTILDGETAGTGTNVVRVTAGAGNSSETPFAPSLSSAATVRKAIRKAARTRRTIVR